MTDPKNEVLFCEYCKTCKHKLCDCEDEPCCDCLAAPVNYYSHKPVLWEGIDTLFNKPVERRDHAAERAVREAVYLNAKDTAEAIDEQGTLAGKVHMRDLASNMVTALSAAYSEPPPGPSYKWEEVGDLTISMLGGTFKSDAKVITQDMLKGYYGWWGIDIPNAVEIGDEAFLNCRRLDFSTLLTVNKIGSRAFMNCSGINNNPEALSNVEYIGDNAFSGSSICSIQRSRDSMPYLILNKLTYLGSYAFYKCHILGSVMAPVLENIGNYAFSCCTNLTNVYIDGAKSIGDHAFCDCVNLTQITHQSMNSGRLVENIYDRAFYGCIKLEHLEFMSAINIGDSAFSECSNLSDVVLSHCKLLGSYAFNNCTALRRVNICNVEEIGSNAFHNCYSLAFIDITGVKSVPKLGDDAFDSINPDVRIGVPNNLYDEFFTNESWSAVKNNLIPIATPDMAPAAFIGIVNIGNGSVSNSRASATSGFVRAASYWFPPTSVEHNITPASGYRLDALYDNDVNVTSLTTRTTIDHMLYSIDKVAQGAEYGFDLDSDGWYVSQNKGIQNSYARCRIHYSVLGTTMMTIKLINYAEGNFDFGVVGKLNADLTTFSPDKIKWNGQQHNSSYPVNLGISIPDGTGFIDIAFKKDGSTDKYNDALKFKILDENKVTWTEVINKYTIDLSTDISDASHIIVATFVKDN